MERQESAQRTVVRGAKSVCVKNTDWYAFLARHPTVDGLRLTADFPEGFKITCQFEHPGRWPPKTIRVRQSTTQWGGRGNHRGGVAIPEGHTDVVAVFS